MMISRSTKRSDLIALTSAHAAVAAHLRSVSLFEDIWNQPTVLEALAEVLVDRTFKKEDAIITEGQAGTELFLLISGSAGVYKRTPEGDIYKVAVLNAASHAFFGEGALLDSDMRSATIRAESEVHCLSLRRDAFEKFSAAHPQWALPIVRRIARAVLVRLRKSNDDLMLLYNALIAEIRGS